MRLRHVVLVLVLLCCLSAAVFGLGRFLAGRYAPGPYADAPVIRAPVSKEQRTATEPPETREPVRLPSVVVAAPAPGSLAAVPRQEDPVRDLAAVLAAAYQPADPCAQSSRPGELRISTRELVRRYAPALAESPETSLRLSVTPPMLEFGYLFVSGRFAGEVRSRTRDSQRICPANGQKRSLTDHEADEALVLIAAWLRDLAACTRSRQDSRDCAYAQELARNLLEGERTRERVIATAGRLLDNLARKIDRDIEKTGG